MKAPLFAFLTLGLLAAAPAHAQHQQMQQEIRKKMSEISNLMRESERLLLEMTKIDRLVEQQRSIVEELEKLKPPEQPAEAQASPEEQEQEEARRQKREELEKRQREVRERLEKLFESQDQAAQASVSALEKLLRELPRQQGGQMPQNDPQRDRNRPGEPDREEKKQNPTAKEQPGEQQPKKERDEAKRLEEQKKKEEQEKSARLARIEAWIATLPPAQAERISKNDFSGFPPRYRRLLREYTRLRAEREAREPDRR